MISSEVILKHLRKNALPTEKGLEGLTLVGYRRTDRNPRFDSYMDELDLSYTYDKETKTLYLHDKGTNCNMIRISGTTRLLLPDGRYENDKQYRERMGFHSSFTNMVFGDID